MKGMTMNTMLRRISDILSSEAPVSEAVLVAADVLEEAGLRDQAKLLRAPQMWLMAFRLIRCVIAMPSDGSWSAEFSVELRGQVQGPGRVEFSIDGELIDQFWLPEAEFAVMMLLAMAVVQAGGNPVAAHLTSRELARGLAAHHILETADPQLAVRTVFRLRRRLSRRPIAGLLTAAGVIGQPAAFATHLIQRQHLMGYVLNVREGRLRIIELPPGGGLAIS